MQNHALISYLAGGFGVDLLAPPLDVLQASRYSTAAELNVQTTEECENYKAMACISNRDCPLET